MREIVCKPDFLLASYNSVSWVIKGHGYVILNKARYVHTFIYLKKCVTVRKWLAPRLSFVAMKRERFPPYSRHVRTIRFFISWQGRRKV